MRKRFLIVVFGLLCMVPVVNAQNDNLEPVESIFDDYDFRFQYYSLIRIVLMKGMSDSPEVRFLIIPSFSVEEVVAIEEEKGKYFIIHHKMEKSIWYTEKDKQKIGVIEKKVEILESDVNLYKELFKKAIHHRKYPDRELMGLDGVNYYFSVADRPLKTGTVWSPAEGSKMDRLVNIGNSLISLANETETGKVVVLDAALIQQIKQLTNELDN